MVTSERYPAIDKSFPNAFFDGYQLRSDPDVEYNCVSWALDETHRYWWPSKNPDDDYPHWPSGIPVEVTMEAFIAAIGTKGYKDCGLEGQFENGVEKVAIYAKTVGKQLVPTHVAWQMEDGCWSSKIGSARDIVHTTPDALTSYSGLPTKYGFVVKYMKRSRQARICEVPKPR